MTAPNLISCDASAVKRQLVESFVKAIDPLVDAAFAGELTPRDAERRSWSAIIPVGAMVVTALFAALCRRASERAVIGLGLDRVDVELRMDKDYWATMKTTFGPVRFPWFAFRTPDGKTHAPARALFPLWPLMRVTEVLLEWEAALAADHPFRKAAEALLFFTHGAVDLEDNTIERHAVQVGSAIPRAWTYRTVADIRSILVERATRDSDTGRPIIYASTDAHALRRFVDESWAATWKMSNGIRLWCIDRVTGAIIHVGGEYTWGDCAAVAEIFVALQKSGHLPANGDYGGELIAQVALVTDGMDWIAGRVLPLFPGAVLILDLYHVIEQVAGAARRLYPNSKSKARKLVEQARKALGVRKRTPRVKMRKGKRPPRTPRPPAPTTGDAWAVIRVLWHLVDDNELPERGIEKLWLVLEYIGENRHRMDYGDLRRRGFQIGSGAMESLHRTASQLRLKRPGCSWTAEAAQALLNLRLLQLTGRWDEYWAQHDLAEQVVQRKAA